MAIAEIESEPIVRYSDDQPRDERGQWTDGGGNLLTHPAPWLKDGTTRMPAKYLSPAREARYAADAKAHMASLKGAERVAHLEGVHGGYDHGNEKDNAYWHHVYHDDLVLGRPVPWDPWGGSRAGKMATGDPGHAVALTNIEDRKPFQHPTGTYRVREATVGPNTVLYRGIGDMKELSDAAKAGAWRSQGKFSQHGPEGVLQMAADPKDIATMKYKPFGEGARRLGYESADQWNAGYKHVVAVDASDLRVRGLVNPGGFFSSPDVQAGLGATRPVGLDRVLAIRDITPGGALGPERPDLMAQFRSAATRAGNAITPRHERIEKYSDDQPRDEQGQWSGSGGPSGPGLCYVNTLTHMLDHYRKGDVLVHGQPRLAAPSATDRGVMPAGTRFGHAWIERGKFVIDPQHSVKEPVVMPKDRYYRLGHIDPKDNRRYTQDEAFQAAIRTKVYGPWDDAVKKAEGDVPVDHAQQDAARHLGTLGYGGGRPEHASFSPRNPLVVMALAGLPKRIVEHFRDGHLSRPSAWPTERDPHESAMHALRHELLHAFAYEAAGYGGDAVLGFPRLERAALADRDAIGKDPPVLAILGGVRKGDWAHGWTALADYAMSGGPLTPHLASYFAPLFDEPVSKYAEDQPRDETGKWTDAGGGAGFAGRVGALGDGRHALPRSLGIPRKEMPQIQGSDYGEFFDYARSKGAGVKEGTTPAGSLRPAQDEFNPAAVAKMPPGALTKPVIVSRDGYVLDGTHRWLRILGDGGPDAKMPTVHIDLPARQALDLMLGFPKAGRKDIYPTTVAASLDGGWLQFEKYSDDQARVPAGEPGGGQWSGDGAGGGSAGIPRSAFASRPAPTARTPDTLQQEAVARAFVERGLFGWGTKVYVPDGATLAQRDEAWRTWNARSIYNEQNRNAARDTAQKAVGDAMAADPRVVDAARAMFPTFDHGLTNDQYRREVAGQAAKGFAKEVTSMWSDTSGDGSHVSVALQMSAAKAFGLPKDTGEMIRERFLSHPDWSAGREGPARLLDSTMAERGKMNEVMLRATYANTQRELADRGIKEITLHRGMTVRAEESPDWIAKGGTGTATQQPLSSWTANYNDARSFAKLVTDQPAHGHEPTQGVVMSATFPAERIVSTGRTGFGVLSEYEFVVAGGPVQARAEVVPWGRTGPISETPHDDIFGHGSKSTAAQLGKAPKMYDAGGGKMVTVPKAEIEKYSDDQPRDDHGMWTDGGTGSGGLAPLGPAHHAAAGWERLHRADPYETLAVMTNDGVTMEVSQRQAHNVQISDDLVPRLRGAVVSHNHPSGRGPSGEDLAALKKTGMQEIRAARNGDGTTRVALTAKGREVSEVAFKKAYWHAETTVREHLQGRIDEASIRGDWGRARGLVTIAEAAHEDLVLRVLAGDGLIHADGLKPLPEEFR